MKWLAVFVVRLSPRDGNLHQYTVCQKSEGVPRWKCNSTVPKGGWNFLLHMWLECVCSLQRGIWPLKTDRLLHHQPPAARATLRLLKALCCDCSEASSLVPHLLSLPAYFIVLWIANDGNEGALIFSSYYSPLSFLPFPQVVCVWDGTSVWMY